MPSSLPRLMLVTDRRRTRGRDLADVVAAAVEGGVRLVQIREKDLTDDALRELSVRLRERLPGNVELLVNSAVRVARTLGVGLHLPASAAPLGSTRPRVRRYGRSIHDEHEMLRAVADEVDYLLVGTIFRSESKPGRPAAGLALLERVCRQVHPLPVYAIGGISVSRVPALLHAGAHGVAVTGAILGDNHPRRVAQALTLAIEVGLRARESA